MKNKKGRPKKNLIKVSDKLQLKPLGKPAARTKKIKASPPPTPKELLNG